MTIAILYHFCMNGYSCGQWLPMTKFLVGTFTRSLKNRTKPSAIIFDRALSWSIAPWVLYVLTSTIGSVSLNLPIKRAFIPIKISLSPTRYMKTSRSWMYSFLSSRFGMDILRAPCCKNYLPLCVDNTNTISWIWFKAVHYICFMM